MGLFSALTCEILLCWVFTQASKNHCLSLGKADRWPSTLWEKQRLGWQSEQPGRPVFYLPSLCKMVSKVNLGRLFFSFFKRKITKKAGFWGGCTFSLCPSFSFFPADNKKKKKKLSWTFSFHVFLIWNQHEYLAGYRWHILTLNQHA